MNDVIFIKGLNRRGIEMTAEEKRQAKLQEVLMAAINFHSNKKTKWCKKALLKAIEKWRDDGCYGLKENFWSLIY